MNPANITAFVSWPSAPLTESLVHKSLKHAGISASIASSLPSSFVSLLQWSTYDNLDHELTNNKRKEVLSSSYTVRKMLIRKHFLSRSIQSYLAKHGSSILRVGSPQTWEMELSFADELDEMWTDELWELGKALENTSRWWILKPGMADRGMGIRLFNSKSMLQEILEEFEDSPENEEDETENTSVLTSQLRHFIVQEYLDRPLLLDPSQVSLDKASPELKGHKFHLRVYCVASGALSLYICPNILALFSAIAYTAPTPSAILPIDLSAHLTNTSLQTERGEEGVRLLSELIGCSILSNPPNQDSVLTSESVSAIIDQVAEILAETFKAALENPVHFQPIPNAFELYGVDFLVTHPADHTISADIPPAPCFQVKILEINAEPAIELTGPRLAWILEDLFASISKVCIEPFFSREEADSQSDSSWKIGETRHGLRKCLEVEVHAFKE